MPAMALLGLYPREMKTCPHKNLIWKLTATFFVIAKKRQTMQMSISWWMDKQNVVYLCNRRLFKPCKCLSADEWINKMQCIYVTEDCLVMKRNAALIQAATWTDFENKWKSQSQKTTYHRTPFLWNALNRQIWRDRIYDGYLGGGEWRGEGERLLTGTGYLLGVVRLF